MGQIWRLMNIFGKKDAQRQQRKELWSASNMTLTCSKMWASSYIWDICVREFIITATSNIIKCGKAIRVWHSAGSALPTQSYCVFTISTLIFIIIHHPVTNIILITISIIIIIVAVIIIIVITTSKTKIKIKDNDKTRPATRCAQIIWTSPPAAALPLLLYHKLYRYDYNYDP